jgi:hypothetical protein
MDRLEIVVLRKNMKIGKHLLRNACYSVGSLRTGQLLESQGSDSDPTELMSFPFPPLSLPRTPLSVSSNSRAGRPLPSPLRLRPALRR